MTLRGLLVAWVGFVTAMGTSAGAQGRGINLTRLASSLDLSAPGAARWLARLEASGSDPSAERILAVTTTGEPVMKRDGGRSYVAVDVDLDRLLGQEDRSIVLIHNHPSSVG